ncbi:MAG: serine/threonine protein kinase [Sandaracinaceae bacterium]
MSGAIREDLLPKAGDVVAGQYQIEKMLGHGGMGAVFAAHHMRTQRAVAIKWMLPAAATSPDAVARFISEAEATGRIEHPNVVAIYDFGEDDGAPYLVMERLRGESLRERLDRDGYLPPLEALSVIVPAMRGVKEAHREGIIHRDIKPDNIFLCRGKDGTPREAKVLDFGISKLYDGDGRSNLTGTGMMMGTPSYMSPEQLNAPKDADARFDVYAFGVVLYEAICGRCPYVADGIFQLVAQIMNADPVPPSTLVGGLPAGLDQVILRAMHRDINQRFTSIAEFIDAIEMVRNSTQPGYAGGGRPMGLAATAAIPQLTPNPSLYSQPGMTPAHGGASHPGITPPPATPIPSTAYGTPPGPIARTAMLTPMQSMPGAGYPQGGVPTPMGSYPGMSAPAISTPHAPYGSGPHAAPRSSGSGIGKLLVLAVLALILGGVVSAGGYFLYKRGTRDDTDAPPPVVATNPQVNPVTPPAATQPPMQPEPIATNTPVDPPTPPTPPTPPVVEPTAVQPPTPTEPDRPSEPTSSGRRGRRYSPPPPPPIVHAPPPRPLPPPTSPPVRPRNSGTNGAMIIE